MITMSGKENEIRSAVLEAMTKHLPEKSIEKDKIEEETYEAIERTVIIAARMIFSEIAEKQRILPVMIPRQAILDTEERKQKGIMFAEDLTKVEDVWLKDACDFCGRRKSSVIKRKDGKRICAKCETEQDGE